MPFRRGLVPTRLGSVHYTAVGGSTTTDEDDPSLLPIIGFHMSPRSVDEYKDIMKELKTSPSQSSRLFVALDEFGYGASDSPCQSCSLDEIADCFLTVIVEHLQIDRFVVAGSLMGCYMALSLASRYPTHVKGVVCSNLYYFQQAAREKALAEEQNRQQQPERNDSSAPVPISDSWALQDDGSHISNIWGTRSSWLSPDLNTRASLDNLQYLVKRRERYQQGISIQDGAAFPLPETCSKIICPVLCINGAEAVKFFDAIGMDMSGQCEQAIGFFPPTNKPQVVVLEPPGASINMLNENAKEWLEHVTPFVTNIESTF
eukprot:scaffold220_cov169-Amphora_coffeaeformis.AAC.3